MHLSFEFFPPKNDIGAAAFATTLRNLEALRPDFVSVTCGAGGSSTKTTYDTVQHIRNTTALHVVPHIAYIRQSFTQMTRLLGDYKNLGVQQIVALRGDPATVKNEPELPPGETYPNTVDFVLDLKTRHGFDPIVSAYPDVHPLALSPQQDLDHLKRKAEAGATHAITQFFFTADTFLRFRDKMRIAGINVALTPGILPIHNLTQVLKFATSCGAKIPEGFTSRFERHGTDQNALFEEGVAHATELCQTLRREGVEDFHFYTLNRGAMTARVCGALKLNPPS